MVFEGSVKTRFDSLKIVNISGKDRLCTECGTPFKTGDAVIAFSSTHYKEDDSVVLSEIFLVHVDRIVGDSTCFEKFSVRMIENLTPPAQAPSEPSTQIVPVAP